MEPLAPRPRLARLERLLFAAAALAAAYYILLFFHIAFSRIGFNFDLEWLEGGTVDHVLRVLRGEPLYAAPSQEWAPALYTPFYYYVAAAVSGLTGPGYLPCRLVSILSTTAAFLLIYLIVRRETGRALPGFLSAGVFAATFSLAAGFFDLARVDMLYVALILAALYLIRFHPTPGGFLAAGVLFFLAIFTKQAAWVVWAAMLGYAVARQRRLSLYLFLSTAGLTLLAGLIGVLASDGWFWVYTILVPFGHEAVKGMLGGFWRHDLLRPLYPAILLTLLGLGHWIRSKRFEEAWFYGLAFGGLTAVSYLSRLHQGGESNVVIPAYAALAIGAGLGLGALRERLGCWQIHQSALMILLLFQFFLLRYDVSRHLPTAEDERALNELIETIRGFKGEVLVAHHGYIGALAGKKSHMHRRAYADYEHSRLTPDKEAFHADIAGRLERKEYAAVIIDFSFEPEALGKSYRYAGPAIKSPDGLWSRSTFRTRPSEIWLPRE